MNLGFGAVTYGMLGAKDRVSDKNIDSFLFLFFSVKMYKYNMIAGKRQLNIWDIHYHDDAVHAIA